jgi:hypothetical protein
VEFGMSSIDSRITLAAEWFTRTQSVVSNGAGWGWVSDVPPNPQNTAEVICALSGAGIEVPNRAGAERLVRSSMVDSPRGGWAFSEPIDIAWRLRALNALDVGVGDPEVVAGVNALLSAQLADGCWRMADGEGPVSVTATACAVLALTAFPSENALVGARSAIRALSDGVTSGRHEFGSAFAVALSGFVLSRQQVQHVSGRQVRRSLAVASDRLLEYLELRTYAAEEETFVRAGLIDTWRHLTLPLALRAVAAANPDAIFEQSFRDGLVAMLALQDTMPDNVSFGAFRSSRDGFITSYATTQAIEALTEVRVSLTEKVNPAIAFDLICRRDGAHHTDAQRIGSIGRHAIILNSTAALGFMVVSAVAGASLVLSALLLAARSDLGLSRGLMVLGSVVAGFGVSAYASARMHRTPRQRVVLIAFTLFTALVLPVLTFVLQ